MIYAAISVAASLYVKRIGAMRWIDVAISALAVVLLGVPAVSLPVLQTLGLPLGLQLIGRPFDEETLFALGETIEQSAGRVTLPDPWWA